MAPTSTTRTVLAVAACLVALPAATYAQDNVANAAADTTIGNVDATLPDPALNVSTDPGVATTATTTTGNIATTDPALAVPVDDGFADLNDTTSAPPVETRREDDRDFPWGLLGLLGLAGLLGRKTRDDRIHVDNRRTR